MRDSAFLNTPDDLGGFRVRQMTLRDYLALQLAKSPLLQPDGIPSATDLAAFLWLLSPHWSASGWKRKRFFAKCRRVFVIPSDPWLHTSRAMRRWRRKKERSIRRAVGLIGSVQKYVGETMQDRPKGSSSAGFTPSYYSDVCFWWGLLGRNGYPMTLEQLLGTPVKILFQVLKEIRQHQGNPINNPSDGVRSDFMLKLNEELRKGRE